ncbi:MAG: glycosyltransferase family 39 protein [Chloroflexi bacterium]|nr:glycosyltransferase family 39 protein [Chloroflexota bacterium]
MAMYPSDRRRWAIPNWVVGGIPRVWIAVAWTVLLSALFYPRGVEIISDIANWVGSARIDNLMVGWALDIFEGLGTANISAASALTSLWKSGLKEVVPLALIALAALATGRALSSRLVPDAQTGIEVMLARLGLGLGVIAYATVLLALLAMLNRPVVLILALAWSVLIFKSIRQSIGELAALARASLSEVGNLRRSFSALAASAIVIYAALALVGALAPETEFDALWHHLFFPKLFVETGTLVDVPEEVVSQYPMTVEMLYAVGLMLRGETLAKLIHFMFGILSAFLTYYLARSVASRQSALVAAAIFLSTPTVLWEMTTAYIDLGLTFFVNLSLLAILKWSMSRSSGWLIVSAAAMGFALGTELLAALALSGIAVWIIFQRSVAQEKISRLPERATIHKREFQLAAPSLNSFRTAALHALIAVAIASPWYIKNSIINGNPVYPLLYQGIATPGLHWSDVGRQAADFFQAELGPGSDMLAGAGVLWGMTLQPWRFDGELGPIFLALVPFGILAARRAGTSALCLAWFSIAYTALWASPISSLQMRFMIPVVPALSALIALAIDSLMQQRQGAANWIGNWFLRFWIIILLFANLPWLADFRGFREQALGNYTSSVVRAVPFEVVWGSETRENYLARRIAGFRAIQYANRVLPPDARILSFFGGLNFHSARKVVPYSSPSLPLDIVRQDSADDCALAQKLRAGGITHVLFDKKMWQNQARDYAILRQSFFDSHIYFVYEDDEALLYALKSPPDFCSNQYPTSLLSRN